MFKVTGLVHLVDGASVEAAAHLISTLRTFAASSGASRALVESTLPGVRNGGDLLIHLHFERAADWQAARSRFDSAVDVPLIDHIDEVSYLSGHSGAQAENATPATVYRTLLLRVEGDASEQQVRRFEDETLRMPTFIEPMTSWQLSPVTSARGPQYTHVWEQEFTDLDGLMGPYLAHPVHWAYVDKWFDPECPDVIIRDRVCHSFCKIDTPVIDYVVP